MSAVVLKRETFATSRLLEFFTEKELTMQIGHPKGLWPLALLKELIDNALDAAESAGTDPEIVVAVEPDALTVRDNGPGLPAATLERSLDYAVRVSDKAHYVSPTRGQLGNALKCLWAAPFVADGRRGEIEVATGGARHLITVTLDRIGQRPVLDRTSAADESVRIGTAVTMRWRDVACSLGAARRAGSYDARDLLRLYAVFNPHATLRLEEAGGAHEFAATTPGWRKWRPDQPTAPSWYTTEQLVALVAALIDRDRTTGRSRTVREFVADFAGLAGTAKQKAVTETARLAAGARLEDLVADGDVDAALVLRLRVAMWMHARPVKPAALGVLGEAHLTARLVDGWGVAEQSVRYKRIVGETVGSDPLPFVIECAFGVRGGPGRAILAGLNFAPALNPAAVGPLGQLLGQQRVDRHDPVALVAHVACPRLGFTDRGKAAVTFADETKDAA